MSINYEAHEQWYHSAISWFSSAEDWPSKQWPRTAEFNVVLNHHSPDLAAGETHAVTGRRFFCGFQRAWVNMLFAIYFSPLLKHCLVMLSVGFRNGSLREKFPSARFSPIYLSVFHCLYYFALTCITNSQLLYTSSPTTWNELFLWKLPSAPHTSSVCLLFSSCFPQTPHYRKAEIMPFRHE